MEIKNFPKLESPFVRDSENHYCVTPEIAEGYEWVFEDEDVIPTEKLHGTNVSIVIEDGKITRIFNRNNEVPFFSANVGNRIIIDAVLNAYEKGYCNFTDGQYFGEVIGKKLWGAYSDAMKVDHIWIPFDTYCRKHLAYKSWGKYPKDFDSISKWFKEDIFSLFMKKRGIDAKPEGIVFVQPSTGKMAKLRLDMFDWFKGERHKEKENQKI